MIEALNLKSGFYLIDGRTCLVLAGPFNRRHEGQQALSAFDPGAVAILEVTKDGLPWSIIP